MDGPSGNVFGITVEPKTVREPYKRHEITVTFLPATGEWRWTFTHSTTIQHYGKGKTLQLALKKAREQIDIIIGDNDG